jgi:hypothetical protein
MDYGLINLWLKDHRKEGFNDRTVWKLYNLVVKFGKETEYPVCRYVLRIFYKELVVSMDEKKKRIPGKISDKRLDEIIFIIEQLIHDYYFMNRFKKS